MESYMKLLSDIQKEWKPDENSSPEVRELYSQAESLWVLSMKRYTESHSLYHAGARKESAIVAFEAKKLYDKAMVLFSKAQNLEAEQRKEMMKHFHDPLDEAIHNDTEKMRLMERHIEIVQEIYDLLKEDKAIRAELKGME